MNDIWPRNQSSRNHFNDSEQEVTRVLVDKHRGSYFHPVTYGQTESSFSVMNDNSCISRNKKGGLWDSIKHHRHGMCTFTFIFASAFER